MSPRAIQQAPFRVLVGANMPAVLVEMGFISNPSRKNSSGRRRFRRQSSRRSWRASSGSAQPRGTRDSSAGAEPGADAAPGSSGSALPRWRSSVHGCSSRGSLDARRGRPTARPCTQAPPAAAAARSTRRSTTSPKTACRSSACSAKCRLASGSREQARWIVEAQLRRRRRSRSRPRSRGDDAARRVRDRTCGDAFVDAERRVRGPQRAARRHTGGALDELFTIYAIVNARHVNLPAISACRS